ncbi:MAG: ATP-dependent Clp protease ATP-binding subunit [Bacteroidaceae bacterium]|nr:ATP-dependent Clp protease ATP-binding subunit [Bacteroidaceae bacterium]
MSKRFSSDVTALLSLSREEALRLYNDKVTPAHLMLAMIRQEQGHTREVLERLNINILQLKQRLENIVRKQSGEVPFSTDEMTLDEAASRIMRLSVLESMVTRSEDIEVEHILLAIAREQNNEVSQMLKGQNVTYQDLMQMLFPDPNTTGGEVQDGYEYEDDEEDETEGHITSQSTGTAPSGNEKEGTESQTPVLDKFGTDLTRAAAEHLLDPVVGREREIERVAQILSRRKKNNPILIGEPGVGKSAIVEGLAQRIVEHHISRMLWDKRVIVLDLGAVVAGTKYRGQFEERMRAIMLELQKHPEVIVFIDEIHTMIGAGSAAGTMDAANMLKPALSRGEVQCIGATTVDEYRKSIEKDGALERRFQKVMVSPTTPEETLQILQNLKGRYEEHHNVRYTDEALTACVKLTERYISDRSFPDKAIDAMDEAGSRSHIMNIPVSHEVEFMEKQLAELEELKQRAVKAEEFQLAGEYRDQQKTLELALELKRKEWEATLKDDPQVVDEEQIASVVAMMTGIPVQRIGEEENQRLRNLSATLQTKVVGQDDAIRAITRAIQRSRVGLKDPQKPIGTFLFVGPTGVGKTYLTKKLAEEMFGTEKSLIRIDMSEYGEKHTVSRMVGAPPGYVGYEEGGQLTEKVRRQPYSIVLLDEIEKAHQDVFNILLQVMDEGRLTDGNGTTIDFRNTIIIMTSNCGTRQLKDFGQGIGFSTSSDISQDKAKSRDVIHKSINKLFAPEFLNRLDDIVFFDQLSEESIKQIVDIEAAPLMGRIREMGYTLELTDTAKALLARKSYDVQYGARPLKRALQTLLEDPICELLMSDEAPVPGSVLTAEAEGEELRVKN